jgi:hypothetical protein
MLSYPNRGKLPPKKNADNGDYAMTSEILKFLAEHAFQAIDKIVDIYVAAKETENLRSEEETHMLRDFAFKLSGAVDKIRSVVTRDNDQA